jgi:hypothetical protein
MKSPMGKKININKVVVRYVFYTLSVLLVIFYLSPLTIKTFYEAWGLIALVVVVFIFPLVLIAYPTIAIIKDFTNWQGFISGYIVILLVLLMIYFARKWSEESLEEGIVKSVRRTIFWLGSLWAEFIGFVVLLPLSILFIFFGSFRQSIFMICLFNKMWRRDFKYLYQTLFFFFYLQIAFSVPAIAYYRFGEKMIFEGIAVAGLLLTFTAFQFQKMTPPYYDAVFLPSEGRSYIDEPKTILRIKSGEKTLLFVRVTNLGLSNFKDCIFSIIFPDGFEILKDLRIYKGIDFFKEFELQKKNRCIQFLPDANYLTFTPCNHLVFPVWVTVPKKIGKYKIVSTLSSESAWGEASREFLEIEVIGG